MICRIGGEADHLREEAGDTVSKYQEGLGTADYLDQVHFFGEVNIVDPISLGGLSGPGGLSGQGSALYNNYMGGLLGGEYENPDRVLTGQVAHRNAIFLCSWD